MLLFFGMMSKDTELLDYLRSFGKLILMVAIFRLGPAQSISRKTATTRLRSIILSLPLHLPHKSSPADSMSPAPPACCQTLPKHNVVWNCLGVVVAGFRSVAWVRCRHCVCVGSGSFCSWPPTVLFFACSFCFVVLVFGSVCCFVGFLFWIVY